MPHHCHSGALRLRLLFAAFLFSRFALAARNQCNYKKGRWVLTSSIPTYAPLYTSCPPFQCAFPPSNKPSPASFVWQPDAPCSYAKWRFSASRFLNRYRNAVVSVIGDSLAFNTYASLRCILSNHSRGEETIVKYSGYDYTATVFKSFNMTLVIYQSGYLVSPPKFNNLKRKWTSLVPHSRAVILNVGHWFWHKVGGGWAVQHKGVKTPVATMQRVLFNVRQFFDRKARKDRRRKVLFLSFSPIHKPQICASRTPIKSMKAAQQSVISNVLPSFLAQEQVFRNSSVQFLDVTRMSMLRRDGHPQSFLVPSDGDRNDCSHWCLPGVPDAWSNVIYSKLVPAY